MKTYLIRYIDGAEKIAEMRSPVPPHTLGFDLLILAEIGSIDPLEIVEID